MGLRDWLKKGVLTVGLAGIIASGSCNRPHYYWRLLEVEKTSIEKSEKKRLAYEITEGSFLLKEKGLGLLKVSVIEKIIKEYYECPVTVKKFGRYKEGYFTGETKQESDTIAPKKVHEEREVKPASFIPLSLWVNSSIPAIFEIITDTKANEYILKTNKDGTLETEIRINSYEEYGIFLSSKYIEDFDWKHIKEPAESFIANYLIIKAEKTTGDIRIMTEVSNAENNSKSLGNLKIWRINDSLLEDAVKQFIKEKISNKLKYVTISLLDFESHTPITRTKDKGESMIPGNISLEPIKVPTKEELIGQYFEGKFSQLASTTLDDYIATTRKVSTDTEKGEVSFYVYIPSKFKVKITHPKYHYVSDQELNFSEKSLDKEVYMSKIGKKVDLRIIDKKPESKIKDKE